MPTHSGHPTVFYSWQSDAPSKTNRGLIEEALHAAVKAIANDATVDLAPRVDRDTAGVAGSPDIGHTILAKIDTAAVFVADVSLVLQDRASDRKSPNPNVLFELGYAWKSHGDRRVILVVNDHFGGPEQLPFDLRTKRALRYTCDPDVPERADARKALSIALEAALRLAFDEMPKPPPALSAFDSAVDAIRTVRPGRDVVVEAAAREIIEAAIATGVELRDGIANEHHPESAERVFELLSAPAEHLAKFASLVRVLAEAEDAVALEVVLRSLDTALEATWIDRTYTGSIPLRHLDFARVLSAWLYLAVVAMVITRKRYGMLRVIFDHRFSPAHLEHERERDGGHDFTVFQQEVRSSVVWRPSPHETYRSAVGAALERVTVAVRAVDAKSPSFEEIMAADALLAFAAGAEENDCRRGWHPLTSVYARDQRFQWFRDLTRRRTAIPILRAVGLADEEKARASWQSVSRSMGHGHSFTRYDQMKAETIASVP